jgi:hypothetical protein
MLQREVGQCEGNVPEMDFDGKKEFLEILRIITQNFEVWADGNL